jgi:hypothetical protein
MSHRHTQTDTDNQTAKDLEWYIAEFRSEECLCGRSKQPTRPFCYRCYSELPAHMKKAVWQRFRNGYEEAFEDAVQWLQQNIW